MIIRSFIFCFLFSVFISVIDTNSDCHYIYDGYFQYLATKTGYRFIQNEDESPIVYPQCEVSKIWGLIRHGTRLPGDKIIGKMKNNLKNIQKNIIDYYSIGKSNLCDINNFKLWTPKVQIEDLEKSLTEEGKKELFNLGRRLKSRFPYLLNQKFNNNTFLFKYTKTQRTQESAFQFVEGIFGREESTEVWYPQSQNRDPILRFYKACEKWRQTVDKNPDAYEESVKFQESKIFKNMIAQVSKRLGYDEILSTGDIILMYTTCAFETAWYPDVESPWCAIFTKTELEVLEYNEDLEYYWIDGHGYSLTGDIACVAFQDMFNTLSTNSNQDAVFYFTHSGTLLKFLTHLNLYNESVPLRHDNYQTKINRTWKVSKIDSFGANIVFVKYKCDKGDYVLVLHQEKPILLPGCTQELCPLKTIENIYHKSLHNCNFEQQCRFDGKLKLSLQNDAIDHDHDEL